MKATRRLAGLALVLATAVALPLTLAQPASASCAPGTYPPNSCAPTVVMTGPPVPFSLRQAHPAWSVQYSAAAIQKFQVRYVRYAWNGVSEGWVYPASWQNLTITTLTQDLSVGYTYCYAARAVDTANRVGAWSASRCTARPLDDRSLFTSSGWTRGSGSSFYLQSYITTRTLNAHAYRPYANVSRVGVVASVCPNCGKVAVYVGNTQVGTLNFYSATTRHQQIFTLGRFAYRAGVTVTLRNLVSGKNVYIDGLGISRV